MTRVLGCEAIKRLEFDPANAGEFITVIQQFIFGLSRTNHYINSAQKDRKEVQGHMSLFCSFFFAKNGTRKTRANFRNLLYVLWPDGAKTCNNCNGCR